MKVLIVSNLYPPDVIGGYELLCAQMVEELRRRGHDVVVLTSAPRHPCPASEGVRRTFQLNDVYDPALARAQPITRHHVEARANFVDPANVHTFLTTLADVEPDVVYFWNLVGFGGLALVAVTGYLDMPWMWHLADSVPRALCALDDAVVGPVALAFSRLLDGRFLGCSQRVIDEVQRDGPQLTGSVEIVPNWVAGTRPAPRSTWRDKGTLRVVSAGQLTPVKGAGIAVEAVAQLLAAGRHDVTLDVYGGGAPEWLEGLIMQLGVDPFVRFLGPRHNVELVDLFGGYDVFLLPTWDREPFAITQLEAASRGCLCVISRNCGNAEWMVDGVHCIKAAHATESFASALRRIADGDDGVWQIARRAQAVVLRDFHIDRVADRVESALHERAGSKHPRLERADTAYSVALQAARLVRDLIDESDLTHTTEGVPTHART